MERLWEHVEHLAPGLVLAVLAFISLADAAARAHVAAPNIPRDTIFTGGAFLAFGYVLGVINSSLARLVFVDLVPLLDWLRWRHLARAARNNSALAGAIADVRWSADFAAVEKHVREGRGAPWQQDSRSRRRRAVFDSLSGRAQKLGSPIAEELAQRRREARLMRATVLPIVAAGIYLVAKSITVGGPAALVLLVLTLVAYYSREVSVINTFEAYAEAIYEKRFQPLGK